MLTRVTRLLGRDLYHTLAEESEAAGLPTGPIDDTPVEESELDGLPEPVRHYLRFMGVVGLARHWSFRAHLTGRFRLRRGQRFMRCEAWQYNSALEIARIFHMRIDFAGFVPMVGCDVYLRGHGRMQGKLLGLVTVADGEGPEFDTGELTTYLNDAVMWAPSMLLGPATTWTGVDDRSFDVALTDAGRTVTARVFLDGRGAPRDFSTTDRYADLPGGLVRSRWTTPVTGWTIDDGRAHPGHGSAIWHLPDGELPYGEFDFAPGAVEYNVAPGDPLRVVTRPRSGAPSG